MPVEESRRLELHRQASGSWGQEAADTLLELAVPAGHEMATRADIDRLAERIDARFAAYQERIDARFATAEARSAAFEERMDARFVSLQQELTATFERRISDAVTTQTRTLVFSQLGALIVIAALAFGLQ